MNVFNVVLGAVAVEIGLTFWWALIAIAVGTLIGALLIALHATQGPRLGRAADASRAAASSASTGPRSCSPPCCC